MRTIRTDLAAEAHELFKESTGKTTQLPGVRARDEEAEGFRVHRVEILDHEGAMALRKSVGTYLTLELPNGRLADCMDTAAEAIASLLSPMLPEEGTILVAGLGNRDMTPDAIGPLTLDGLLVTRHLGKILPGFRSVAAIGAGVLASTGMEAAEWIRGAAARIQPEAVIVVDALAARSLTRLCRTVQIADSGLIPGSGVGNHRAALNRETLRVPVISLGVPTVVEAATLARDLLGEDTDLPGEAGAPFFVTPENIDRRVRELGKLLGRGISLAAQSHIAAEDVIALLES